ncbi:hypothetical protein H70357_24605 [Paenibacillus sp. FSL H7-0357]|nr:hypothetical protein H70357_24605 [Paenibacillus sp. FSL H7-0357]
MSSGVKRHRRITPMPVVSSFPPPNRATCHSECITRQMTPQEYTDMIAKYGPPKMPLKQNKSHYLSGKKGKKGA